MRLAGTSSIAAAALTMLGLALLGCGEDGDGGAGGAASGDEVRSGTATPADATGTGPGSGSAGDGGSIDIASATPAVTGVGGGDDTGSTGSGEVEGCLGENLLGDLGRDRVMVGASLGDELAATTPLDVRYMRLSGQLPDGPGPCDSCAESCRVAGSTCSDENEGEPGCDWWGCAQSDPEQPGALVRDFAATARKGGQIPMVTYYLVLESSGSNDSVDELAAVTDGAYLARYLADFRFMLENLGAGPALVHVEPDFWGYAQQSNPDPHAIPAAVPAANPTDCGDQEPTLAGLGRCFVAMARIHAPEVKIGLHGSGWATGSDVLQNADASFDVVAHATALGGFLAATAPDADLVFVGAADGDAGYFASLGRETWWDETNRTLPHFHQAFAWSRAVSEAMDRPNLWWQVPFGNMSLSGESTQWNDNRLDYYLSRMNEVAAAHGVGVAFGAGDEDQVTAETDGGHFVERASEYAASGGEPLCTP
jgi:hypothetical protein